MNGSTTYSLSLTRINYRGSNIGDDLLISLAAAGQPPLEFSTKLRNGTDISFSPPISVLAARQHAGAGAISIPLVSAITELDTAERFHDRGRREDTLVLPPIRGSYVARTIVLVRGDPVGDKGRVAFFDLEFAVDVEAEEEELTPPEEIPFPPEPLPQPIPGTIFAFASDVHIGDGTITDDFNGFDDRCFIQMLGWLTNVAKKTGRPLHLVLLGDFLELWEAKANLQVGDVLRNHFAPEDNLATKVAIAKAKVQRVVNAHKLLFEKLKEFSEQHKLSYVLGNHDDDLLNAQVLEQFKASSGIDKIDFFTGAIALPECAIWAEHGHIFDDFNYAANFGAKPNGRLVVEQISTFLEEAETFQLLVNQMIIRPRVRNPFNQFDSVATFEEYINCLEVKGYFTPRSEIIQRLSDEIDKLIKGRDIDPTQGDPQVLRGIKNALEKFGVDGISAVKRFSPLERVKFILKIIEGERQENSPNQDDAKTRIVMGQPQQCILMGHNHSPEMSVIGADERYINTGNWQDSGSADPDSPDCFKLGPHRHVTLVYRAPEANRPRQVRADMYTFPNASLVNKIFYNLK